MIANWDAKVLWSQSIIDWLNEHIRVCIESTRAAENSLDAIQILGHQILNFLCYSFVASNFSYRTVKWHFWYGDVFNNNKIEKIQEHSLCSLFNFFANLISGICKHGTLEIAAYTIQCVQCIGRRWMQNESECPLSSQTVLSPCNSLSTENIKHCTNQQDLETENILLRRIPLMEFSLQGVIVHIDLN